MRFVAVLLMLLTATATQAQEPVNAYGADVFKALLLHHGLQPVRFLRNPDDAATTVLVIYGSKDTDPHAAQIQEWAQFIIASGGAVLIATDHLTLLDAYQPRAWLTAMVHGGSVRDPKSCFQNNPELPLLVFDPKLADNHSDLLAIARLSRVATNRPSFITKAVSDRWLNSFGTYSESAYVVNQKSPKVKTGMAIGQWDKATAVVLADAGVLSNQMLLQPAGPEGVDNFTFAYHLASYLAHGNGKAPPRTKCLFWESGILVTDFDRVPLAASPPMPQPSWAMMQKALAENLDKKIDELQREDFPTANLVRAAARNENGFSPQDRRERANRKLTAIVAAVAAILSLLWLVRRIRGGVIERPTPAEPESHVPAGPPAIRERLRLQLTEWGLNPGQSPPVVAVEGSHFYRKRMERTLRSLCRLANPAAGATPRQWRRASRLLDEVNDAHRAGTVRFPAEAAS